MPKYALSSSADHVNNNSPDLTVFASHKRLSCNPSLYVPEAKRQQLSAVYDPNLKTNTFQDYNNMLELSEKKVLSPYNDINCDKPSPPPQTNRAAFITEDEDYQNNIANSTGYIASLMKIVQTSDENELFNASPQTNLIHQQPFNLQEKTIKTDYFANEREATELEEDDFDLSNLPTSVYDLQTQKFGESLGILSPPASALFPSHHNSLSRRGWGSFNSSNSSASTRSHSTMSEGLPDCLDDDGDLLDPDDLEVAMINETFEEQQKQVLKYENLKSVFYGMGPDAATEEEERSLEEGIINATKANQKMKESIQSLESTPQLKSNSSSYSNTSYMFYPGKFICLYFMVLVVPQEIDNSMNEFLPACDSMDDKISKQNNKDFIDEDQSDNKYKFKLGIAMEKMRILDEMRAATETPTDNEDGQSANSLSRIIDNLNSIINEDDLENEDYLNSINETSEKLDNTCSSYSLSTKDESYTDIMEEKVFLSDSLLKEADFPLDETYFGDETDQSLNTSSSNKSIYSDDQKTANNTNTFIEDCEVPVCDFIVPCSEEENENVIPLNSRSSFQSELLYEDILNLKNEAILKGKIFIVYILCFLELSNVLEAYCVTSAKSDLEMNLAMSMLGLEEAAIKKVDDRHFLLIFPDRFKASEAVCSTRSGWLRLRPLLSASKQSIEKAILWKSMLLPKNFIGGENNKKSVARRMIATSINIGLSASDGHKKFSTIKPLLSNASSNEQLDFLHKNKNHSIDP